MQIPLEGVNKQLAHEYLVEKFRAQRSERRNRWISQQKHQERAKRKIKILFGRLHIDSRMYDIEIDAINNCIEVIERR